MIRFTLLFIVSDGSVHPLALTKNGFKLGLFCCGSDIAEMADCRDFHMNLARESPPF